MPQGTQHVDFGATLRQAREQRGIPLRAIADATKISFPALEALERNDISHLPGGIFTRSFVRAYAREVGLDPEDAVRRFIASFPGQEPSAADTPPKMTIREDDRLDQGTGVRRVVGRVLTFAAAIALIIAYLAWSGRLASWRGAGTMAGTAAPPSAAPAIVVEPMEETVVVKPADQPGAALMAGEAGVAPAAPPEAQPPPAAASDAATLPEGTLRLTLRARGRCWVSLRSDGIHVFAGTMEEGEEREVDVRGRISLTVGDAGAFSYSINGMPARPMGGAGEVITVVFNAQNYKQQLQLQ